MSLAGTSNRRHDPSGAAASASTAPALATTTAPGRSRAATPGQWLACITHADQRFEDDRHRPQVGVGDDDRRLGLAAAHLPAVVGAQHDLAPLGGRGQRQRLGAQLDALTTDAAEEHFALHRLMLPPPLPSR